jgi:hypothetical protein
VRASGVLCSARAHRFNHFRAGYRRSHGDRSGRIDQLVKALTPFGSRVVIAKGQHSSAEVDLRHLAERSHVDARSAKLVGAGRDQAIRTLDDPGNQIRNPARRIGRVGTTLQYEHVQLRIAPPCDCRGTHARSVPTHYREAAHGSPVQGNLLAIEPPQNTGSVIMNSL